MFKSLISTRTRCDVPVCAWPVWLFGGVCESPLGKKPVNALIQAREPRLWTRVKTRRVRIGTSRTEKSAGAGGLTAKTAGIQLQGRERMFHRGLTNLFKALVVIGATAHPIEVLRDHWMIVVRQCKPVQRLLSGVARVSSHREADLGPALPNCANPDSSPTMTSGPGTSRGTPGAPRSGGSTADLASPLTTCVISIGCMVAVAEILPTTEPASNGRPSFCGKLF